MPTDDVTVGILNSRTCAARSLIINSPFASFVSHSCLLSICHLPLKPISFGTSVGAQPSVRGEQAFAGATSARPRVKGSSRLRPLEN